MNPKFGCELSDFVFHSVDSLLINRVKDAISTAVLNFEPRITLDEIAVDVSKAFEGKIVVALDYTIRKINVRSNIVYPFYFREGTNIQHL